MYVPTNSASWLAVRASVCVCGVLRQRRDPNLCGSSGQKKQKKNKETSTRTGTGRPAEEQEQEGHDEQEEEQAQEQKEQEQEQEQEPGALKCHLNSI